MKSTIQNFRIRQPLKSLSAGIKFYKLILCGFCCLTLLSGCGSQQKENSESNASPDTIEDTKSLGEFSIKDIEGNTYTQDMFADYELTMINVFTTWCTPCIREIPDLQKLSKNMSENGVAVVGIVLDSIDNSGKTNDETVEQAKLLAEKTGAEYPFLIPDESFLNGRLYGINAVPETFFVDKNGNIVGETYSGSRSLDEWTEIINKELKGTSK